MNVKQSMKLTMIYHDDTPRRENQFDEAVKNFLKAKRMSASIKVDDEKTAALVSRNLRSAVSRAGKAVVVVKRIGTEVWMINRAIKGGASDGNET